MLSDKTQPTSPARILICEDEVMLARDIERTLQQLGYEVTGRVSSGEGALSVAEETKPDLVLMDIQLEGAIDGWGYRRNKGRREDSW